MTANPLNEVAFRSEGRRNQNVHAGKVSVFNNVPFLLSEDRSLALQRLTDALGKRVKAGSKK